LIIRDEVMGNGDLKLRREFFFHQIKYHHPSLGLIAVLTANDKSQTQKFACYLSQIYRNFTTNGTIYELYCFWAIKVNFLVSKKLIALKSNQA